MKTQSQDQLFAQVANAHGYQYIKKIGSGGFSNVFLAHSQKYKMDFAIKQIFRHTLQTSEGEIQALIKLIHPGIIQIFDFFKDEENFYLVLEYCPLGNLQDHVMKNGPLETNPLLSICLEITKALEYCHNNKIAHLDIKPTNIFIDKYGRPKIADFGLSQEMNDEQAKTTRFDGSICFQSPQVTLCEPYNPFKADVWSLGCTFYYFATGKLPFSSPNKERLSFLIESGLYTIPPTVDKVFAKLIADMLVVEEEERASMLQIKTDLLNIIYERQNMAQIRKPIQSKIKNPPPEDRRASNLSKCARASILPHRRLNRSSLHLSSSMPFL